MRDEILKYENYDNSLELIIKNGSKKILISAPHTIIQTKEDGSVKLNEPYTKAIALFIANKLDTFVIVKNIDTGIDPNSLTLDNYKDKLLNIIKDNDIKLVIDLHGAKVERNFDVEFGTLNNLSADYSTIKELEDAFNEHGVLNVKYNEPFKGGGITQSVYASTDIDVIQIEINGKFRDINNFDGINRICDSLMTFINQYNRYLEEE